MMNRYGVQAKQHWQKHLPRRYQALPNPDQFFEDLGNEVQQRILELEEARRPALGQDYLKNLQQLSWTRFEAESEALQELALLPAEDEENDAETLETDSR